METDGGFGDDHQGLSAEKRRTSADRDDPVRLGNGVVVSRVSPDIAVAVSLDDERTYLKDPYATLAQNDNRSICSNQ